MGLSDVRPTPPPRSGPSLWRWHLAASAWLLLVGIVGLALRPSVEDLRMRARGAATDERLWALHALSQRAPQELEPGLVQDFLEDPDPRVREFVFTNVVSRHTGKEALAPLADRLADPGERWRARFWLRRDVASPQRMTRADLRAYFDSFHGAAAAR